MKKLLIIICLLITGCNQKISLEKEEYNKFIKDINNFKINSITIPCDINVYLDKLTKDEVMFRLVIDNPTEEMHNIKIMVIHNKKTEDIYPSSGIFEKELNLIPNTIDLNNNKVGGIILVGYIPYEKEISTFRINFKGIITYVDIYNNKKNIYFSRQL